jgi:2-hydroxychromene-2-carboxylate isomerase
MDVGPGPGRGATAADASARPTFFFDFSSPETWLAAERVNAALAPVPVWTPVRPGAHAAGGPPHGDELADLAHRAAAQGLPAPRLPEPWPTDLDLALRAATFAAASGRVVAFSLAALRQAFAAGRDLSDADNVLIAAAACELHPRAVLKALESRSVADRLGRASEHAAARGVERLPAIAVGDRVHTGPHAVEQAAEQLALGG